MPTADGWCSRINNAGSNGYKYKTLLESSDADLVSIVETNVLGVMLGCKEVCGPPAHACSGRAAGQPLHGTRPLWGASKSVISHAHAQAIRVMREQPSGGHIFNMDGAGADGGATPRFAAYGATKRGLVQLSKSLQVATMGQTTPVGAGERRSPLLLLVNANMFSFHAGWLLAQAELKMLGINNVGIHNLSPGMVTTDLLMAGAPIPYLPTLSRCTSSDDSLQKRVSCGAADRVCAESHSGAGLVGPDGVQGSTDHRW